MKGLAFDDNDPLGAIVGDNPRIKEIKEIITRIADEDFPVLLEGETGTGKELVARAIHALSSRSKQPFVAVNCGAIPESLMESEFFGHKRGAFTGAIADYEGLFRAADGGTLFLDEISEMPSHIQVKLLRVLENNEVRGIGETRARKVDVRVIAATNRRVNEALRDGVLRLDLYYRISYVHIVLPPLRERKEDIPLLVEHFILKFNKIYRKKIKGITNKALEALQYYHWPGNVRELENVIGRAFALGKGDIITVDDLPMDIWDGKEAVNPEGIISVEEAEKNLIKKALSETGGNKTRAARLLGIGRKTLYMKIKKYGIKI
ncbi:MAG: sigma-54-dependent Fis family transcriptional regulator [Candidatus Hydrothermae bacterium]|nr:sigma-54-dependent Fis family transcriptional regulator [Candidatus Hydrothermae bacterium]